MMACARPDADRGVRRLATAMLLACAAIAVAGLPVDMIPRPWQLALLLPAAGFGTWRAAASHRFLARFTTLASPRFAGSWAFLNPLLPAVGASALQVGACLLAYHWAGPLARPAALAGTILPPLAFVAARGHDTDASLGLFLSFCVLLVGAILGQPSNVTLASYVAAATVQMRCATRLRALAACALAGGHPRASASGRQFGYGLGLAMSCLLAAFAVERTMTYLPTPTSGPVRRPAATPSTHTRAGLDDTFDLSGDGGTLDLRGERLVNVALPGGRTTPANLYLRSGFFQVPGLDTWQVGPLTPQRRDASRADYHLHPPLPGTPLQRLEITRAPGARNRLFVPPGTCSIVGVPELLGDARREWFRQSPSGRVDVYEVIYQDLPPPPDDLPVDSHWDEAGLLDLPPDLDERLFGPLLAEFAPVGPAVAKAEAIANGLQARCRYELREPKGPHAHELLNFLHGERVGFCMHFASAAAILLRMAHVPCRIGVGLYGGVAGANGSREFGSQHSHAWVEIPIVGRGWVPFDPTPPAQRGARADLSVPAQSADIAGQADAQQSLLEWTLTTLRGWFTTAWPYALLLAISVLPFGQHRPAARDTALASRNVRPARRWLLEILRELAERGHRRAAGSTLEQLTNALATRGACPPDLRAALLTYQEVRFGGRPFDHERERCMAKGLAAVRCLPPPTAAD